VPSADALAAHQPVLLETTSTPDAESLSLVAAWPEGIVTGHIDRDWHRVTDTLRAYTLRRAMPNPAAPLPRRDRMPPVTTNPRLTPEGGLFGWVGFDGQFCFGIYPRVLAFHHALPRWSINGDHQPRTGVRTKQIPFQLQFQPLIDRADFIAAVRRAQDYIAAGDIYQVNLSHPWQAAWPADASPLHFYRTLCQASPAPYAAYLDLAGTRVFSSSPECFLRISGRKVETRPIKGTRPRIPHDPEADQASARELSNSAKENAELLMITDLERNDLGQICEFGSVAVTELAAIESFAQVFHLVSTVKGQLRPEIDHATAFKACFPGGSITGAPKKRAREIIAELEPHPRGLYTGAIGYFGFNGQSQFSIAIRTAVQRGDTISFHAGAGIVADSIPEHEYEETLHKASGLLAAAAGGK
jgi:aminodeoxychorismate synthase component I